jgi:squalene-hopene/tetraprenyl-beta-curcumene cyclase
VRNPFVAWVALLGLWTAVAPAQEIVDRQLAIQAFKHTDYGLRYLRENQAEDGSWSGSVGVTALALRAFLESYQGYNESDGAFITRPVGFLLAHANADGSISEGWTNRIRDTALAVIALAATKNPEHEDIIRNARDFLAGAQANEDDGVSRDDPVYGAIAAGDVEPPSLPLQLLAIEALRAAELGLADPVWERSSLFVGRLQNARATNDQQWAGDDGGFIDAPGSAAAGRTGSTAVMTHTGLASLLYAGAGRGDPRVAAAWRWISDSYALDGPSSLPGAPGRFDDYVVFAKSMRAFGEVRLNGADGTQHNWRNDLITSVISHYKPDGSFGDSTAGPGPGEGGVRETALSVIALNQVIRSLR